MRDVNSIKTKEDDLKQEFSFINASFPKPTPDKLMQDSDHNRYTDMSKIKYKYNNFKLIFCHVSVPFKSNYIKLKTPSGCINFND